MIQSLPASDRLSPNANSVLYIRTSSRFFERKGILPEFYLDKGPVSPDCSLAGIVFGLCEVPARSQGQNIYYVVSQLGLVRKRQSGGTRERLRHGLKSCARPPACFPAPRNLVRVDGDNYYLMDVFRRRLNYPDLKRAIIAEGERFRADDIVIEDKSSGTQLIQDLKNDGVLNVVEYKPPPGADKVMRLHACSDRFENGRVLCPPMRRGLTTTSSSLSASRARSTTIRSTPQPRPWTTCASRIFLRPTSRPTRRVCGR